MTRWDGQTLPGRAYRRNPVASVASAASMIALIMVVFSLVDSANVVTTRSADLHLNDATLRQLDTVRAQLAEIVFLATLEGTADPAGIERARVEVADLALLDAANSTTSLSAVRRSALNAVDLAEAGRIVESQTEIDTMFLPATQTEQVLLEKEANRLLDELLDANALLRKFSTFSGLLIAGIVPVVAIFVYRRSTSQPREFAETEARYLLELDKQDQWRQRVLEHLRVLRTESSSSTGVGGPGLDGTGVDDLALDRAMEAVELTSDRHWSRPESVNLDAVVRDRAAAHLFAGKISIEGWVGNVWVDKLQMARTLDDIFSTAHSAGCSWIHLSLSVDRSAGTAELEITTDNPVTGRHSTDHTFLLLSELRLGSMNGRLTAEDSGRRLQLTIPTPISTA